MTLSNQSHFPGFFLSPESHLTGFANPIRWLQQFRLVIFRRHQITEDEMPGPGQFRLMTIRNQGVGELATPRLVDSPIRRVFF